MSALYYLEIVGGVVLILFGVLFFLFLPVNFSELATIFIFIGAGALVIRKAVLNRREEKLKSEVAKKGQSKSAKTRPKKL